jgi:regulatory protein
MAPSKPSSLSLTGRALRLLSAREQSRAELERKLARFEEVPGSLAEVLDKLEAKDFINAQRVVDSVVYRRSAKLGVGRIRQELQAKGLDAEPIAQAVVLLKTTETVRAQEVWRKKFGTTATNPSERAKQARFLAGRGFGGEAIARVVTGAFDPDDS